MTEADIVNAIGALVSTRIYPDVAPVDVVTPFAVWQQVGGYAINYLEPQASDKRNARIQITIWSDSRMETMALIRNVETEMVKSPIFANVNGAPVALYDSATKQYGAAQDFSVMVTV